MQQPVIVLKFGSSVLVNRDCLPEVVHEVYRYHRRGYHVLAVVSAIGQHTDELLGEAKCWLSLPEMAQTNQATAVAELLATGEQRSAALFVMALHRAGIFGSLLSLAGINLLVSGDRLDAVPFSVDIDAIERAFEASPVLVLPGFAGIHESGGTALMGRGGSDLTAIFLAEELGASQCRLLKDVDGIYDRDPASNPATGPGASAGNPPLRYGEVTYDEALRVSGALVQPKALEYLRSRQGAACVAGLLLEDGTHIGARVTCLRDRAPTPPLRVLLLGFGHVGQGVYQHLCNLGNFFRTVGILVRDVDKRRDVQAEGGLLGTDLETLLARQHDLVVDVSAGPDMALDVARRSLLLSRPVVTASKQIVADHGDELEALAARYSTRFSYSAAVGGAVPMLELLHTVVARETVTELRGVLNGTCNYVLDRMSEGVAMDAAVREAQAQGFAEEDVSRDLQGYDSADKMRVLARQAFGVQVGTQCVDLQGCPADSALMSVAAPAGMVVRQVATYKPGGPVTVSLEALPARDYLAGARGEENRLVIKVTGGREWCVSGKGAGRWPTAEAVLADLLDIYAGFAARSAATVAPARGRFT